MEPGQVSGIYRLVVPVILLLDGGSPELDLGEFLLAAL